MKILNKIVLTITLFLGLLNLNLNSMIGRGQLFEIGITRQEITDSGLMVNAANRVYSADGLVSINDIVNNVLSFKIESLQGKMEEFYNLLPSIQTLNDLYNDLSEEYMIIEQSLNKVNQIIDNVNFRLNNVIIENYHHIVELWQNIIIEIEEFEHSLNSASLFNRLTKGFRNLSLLTFLPAGLVGSFATEPIFGIGAGMIQTVAGSVTIGGVAYLIVYFATEKVYRLVRK